MKHLSKNNIVHYWILVFLIFGSTACSLFNSSVQKKEKPHRIRRISDRRLIQQVVSHYLPYRHLQIKFSAHYIQDDKQYALKGFLRTTRDSIIWMSLYHKTGIPVAKIVFTRDSILFLNQLKKHYSSYAYAAFEKNTGYVLNYTIVQGVLFDEFFLYGNKKISLKNLRKIFKLYDDNGIYVFRSLKDRQLKHYAKRNKKNKVLQAFRIQPDSSKIIESTLFDIKHQFNLTIRYLNFVEMDSTFFPKKQQIRITSKTDTIDIALRFKKIKQKNTPLNYTIKRPNSD